MLDVKLDPRSGRGEEEAATGQCLPGQGLPGRYLPGGHPGVARAKVGVLLANLGTPGGTDYWSMRRYLGEFLSDRRVIDYSPWLWQPLLQLVILSRRPFASGAAYRSIWNEERDESPMLTIVRGQTEKIRARLAARHGETVAVDFAMRYGEPSIRARLRGLIAQGCRRILFFPLYPQYAGATTATANDALFRALMDEKWQPAVRSVAAYFDRPGYIEALAGSVERATAGAEREPEVLVCSYHGVPRRYLTAGDPYHCHCHKTTRLLRERLGWGEARVLTTFQSRFGPEEWLRPYTVEAVAELAKAGRKRIAVIAPAFSADCIETLEEIQGEIRESFEAAGGESFTYIPCLNEDEAHIAALCETIEENLAGWV